MKKYETYWMKQAILNFWLENRRLSMIIKKKIMVQEIKLPII